MEEMDFKTFACTCRSLTRESDDYSQDYQGYNQVSLEAVLKSVFQKTG